MSRSSQDPPHPQAWDLWGHVGRDRLWTPTRVGRPRDRGSPVDSEEGRRTQISWGRAPLPPVPLDPGAGSPGPPRPPCRPTGPSSWALLLAGVRRASSKFLLTLAAPVSLPAAGSVLEGGKDSCHLGPPCSETQGHGPATPPGRHRCSQIPQYRACPPQTMSPSALLRREDIEDHVPPAADNPLPSPAPAHFFSFSPTAGDAAGLVSFSLAGDGE